MRRLTLLPKLTETVNYFANDFKSISNERKEILSQLTEFIKARIQTGDSINLHFICTHNSRRSHISQLWAQAAALYYNIENVRCFSGGTEATAFNPRAVKAMQEVGFAISQTTQGANPVYSVVFSADAIPVIAFSKQYDDAVNPDKNFAAVMTCSHADENCPLILGASARIALTYNDPKDSDGTPKEADVYRERVLEIGREILYAFSKV